MRGALKSGNASAKAVHKESLHDEYAHICVGNDQSLTGIFRGQPASSKYAESELELNFLTDQVAMQHWHKKHK